MSKPLEPGVYFDLDETRYHEDKAIGSTDLRRLRRSGPDYWWHSAYNPNRPPVDDVKPTPDRLMGKAMHKLVLEGGKAFERLYMRRPDDKVDATSAEKSAVTKDANAKAAKLGKISLKGDDYDRIIIAGAMIAKNPHLANAFVGGASEVSVFWHDKASGAMLKVRYDKLKPRGIGDLKKITNTHKEDFAFACRSAIARYRYDIQGKHYINGWRPMCHLALEGQIFDGAGELITSGPEVDLLTQCRESKEHAFQWVFFQSEDSPISLSYTLSPENQIAALAQQAIDAALLRWKRCMEEWGPDEMWLLTENAEELSIDEMPSWFGRS